jgi:hypothetical protein
VPDDADNTLKQRAIPDAEFSLSTAQVYWTLTRQAGDPSANDPTGISISASGGVSGGKLVLSGDSTNKYANSNRNPPFRVVTGQQFTVYLRWQRTTAISAASGTNTVLLAQCVTDFGPPYPVSTAVGSGNIQLTRDQVNAVAANQWQETSFVATISNAPKSNAQYPYAHFLVGMPAACTGGVIEVDALIAVAR